MRPSRAASRDQATSAPCALCRRKRALTGRFLCSRCITKPSFTQVERERISRVRAARLMGGDEPAESA